MLRSLSIVVLPSLAAAPALARQAAGDPSDFELAPGLASTVFATDPMMASPVAIHVAPDGGVYVTETQRRKTQNLDIRNNKDWVEVELALTSVAAKEAFYRATLTPEASDANKRPS